MNERARYNLVWALILGTLSAITLVAAAIHWFRDGRPPIYTYWAPQLIILAGIHRAISHFKAFRKASKP